jgi:hypothetical protein
MIWSVTLTKVGAPIVSKAKLSNTTGLMSVCHLPEPNSEEAREVKLAYLVRRFGGKVNGNTTSESGDTNESDPVTSPRIGDQVDIRVICLHCKGLSAFLKALVNSEARSAVAHYHVEGIDGARPYHWEVGPLRHKALVLIFLSTLQEVLRVFKGAAVRVPQDQPAVLHVDCARVPSDPPLCHLKVRHAVADRVLEEALTVEAQVFAG